MRWSLCIAAAILIIIPVFSTPIPRMVLRKRGLFQQTLEATGTTVEELAAKVTNALTSDPRPCSHVISFFQQLAAGETAGGVTTIGDRAVAGARKMLNLQSAGTAGLVEMVNELVEGQLSNSTTTALIQALSNSARTVASLKTYKFLLDTQAGLTNLTDGINNLNGTGLQPVQALVTQIQPVLVELENTIDQFGADFSAQNVANQASDIQNILSLVEDGNGNVQKLKGLNRQNQITVNQLIDAAQNSMNQLAAAAQEASIIANAPPDIPPEQFNYQKGTACTPQGIVGGNAISHSVAGSAASISVTDPGTETIALASSSTVASVSAITSETSVITSLSSSNVASSSSVLATSSIASSAIPSVSPLSA